jgi:ATP-dependent Clp protease ATP-binding subunit ClpB
MDLNRLTQKSQEALHDAQTIALRYGHTEVDGEHLLLALIEQHEGLVAPLLRQAGGDPERIKEAVSSELGRRHVSSRTRRVTPNGSRTTTSRSSTSCSR